MPDKPFFCLPREQVFQALNATLEGLSSQEARKRNQELGYNEIKTEHKTNPFKIFFSQFTNSLVIILIIAAAVLGYLGWMENDVSNFIEAGLIGAIVILNGLLGFVQDYKAEKSIQMLRKLASPKNVVLRDNELLEIDAREITLGDIVVLEEGDVVPAGGILIEASNLETDESSLTGESTPVKKILGVLPEKTPLAERSNSVFTASRILKGHGKVLIIQIGNQTELGKIAHAVESIETQTSPFQIELNELGKKISMGILVIIAIIAITQLALNAESTFIQIFIMAIALAVAAIPEGLPAVITVSLAINTRKMLEKNALVRKLSVIEDLGAVTMICADKTGTLTEGTMAITKTIIGVHEKPVAEWQEKQNWSKEMHYYWNCLCLCNNTKIVNGKLSGDYTEKALLEFAASLDADWQQKQKKHARICEESFSHDTKRMLVLNQFEQENQVLAKGATEKIAKICSHYFDNGKIKPLSQKIRNQIEKIEEDMASQALRVLAVAVKPTQDKKIIAEKMIFLGLLGLSDPIRKGVKQAIGECNQAGIQVKMITGDKAITAQSIAHQLGLNANAITGTELDALNEKELEEKVQSVDVFARVEPRHKVQILSILQKQGHVVAMTGDGVNDAPALKKAEVGIAMGIRGTDVAKQSAELVLLDDNFLSIVEAIKLGRGSFSNIRKFVNYLLTSNFAEVFGVFFASLAGFLPLTAVHLLLINVFTDGGPAIALGLDAPTKEVMKQKPKPKNEGVINKRLSYLIIGMGSQLTIIILFVIFAGLFFFVDDLLVRSMVFMAFILFELNRIAVIRQAEGTPFLSNKWLNLAMLASLVFALVLIYSPLNALVGLTPLGWEQWSIIGIGLIAGWFSSQWITQKIVAITPTA
ncbi:calcium-translocating P-type ATPase, PMCA-type [Candidatus Micrarchaeota archaeon]|nr:calcium-translocating P-type ATPase, PMCA-type [Candidatus Micrarchaeota archaeon]